MLFRFLFVLVSSSDYKNYFEKTKTPVEHTRIRYSIETQEKTKPITFDEFKTKPNKPSINEKH